MSGRLVGAGCWGGGVVDPMMGWTHMDAHRVMCIGHAVLNMRVCVPSDPPPVLAVFFGFL